MKVENLDIPEVLLFEPKVFGDERGCFFESYNKQVFDELTGLDVNFVQDNFSRSSRGVLRGLHYQLQNPQGKLVSVLSGEVFDVAVDIRRSSNTFGQWVGAYLSGQNHKQLWVPPGFAHGFVVLSDTVDFTYKVTDFYAPEHDRCILWNDPVLAVDWPMDKEPVLSEKDRAGCLFDVAEVYS
jgi:dTDP-4-dehydrorhamnose 3,5-epimerase